MDSTYFDFKKKEKCVFKIDDNILLHLEQIQNSYCTLYFTTEESITDDDPSQPETHLQPIIPPDIVIYETVFSDEHQISHPITPRKYYYLSWSENYLVKYKNQWILNMHNPCIWHIENMSPEPI